MTLMMSSSQGTMIYFYLQLTQRNQVCSVKMTFKVMENFIFIPLKLIILHSVSCAQCCLCLYIDNLIYNIMYFFTLYKYLFMFIRNFFVAKLITIFLDRFIAVMWCFVDHYSSFCSFDLSSILYLFFFD